MREFLIIIILLFSLCGLSQQDNWQERLQLTKEKQAKEHVQDSIKKEDKKREQIALLKQDSLDELQRNKPSRCSDPNINKKNQVKYRKPKKTTK